jgi:hypothetical protein
MEPANAPRANRLAGRVAPDAPLRQEQVEKDDVTLVTQRRTVRVGSVTIRPVLALDLALKSALVGLLVFAVARQDLPQFHGKAMTGRALTYPIAALIVPAVWWWLRRHGRRIAYPYALDVLLVLPFLIDTAGNAANLYDTISWWDDVNHLVNWAILTAGFGQLLVRLRLERWAAWGLAVGFGAVTAVLWEFGEYYTFIRHSSELQTAYTDTLGDLALGLTGSAVAATLTTTVLWPKSAEHGADAGGAVVEAPPLADG